MKSPYVNELEPDRLIVTSFLVHSKEIRQKKSGELYLSMLLGDRTGELDAKMWDNVSDALDAFERDDFVKVKGLIQVFHNRPQLTVHKMRRMADSEVDYADYFPSSKRDPEEMWRDLRGIVSGMRNAHLRGLLESLLNDEDIGRRYRRAPAAKQIHHAYLGGLIEHVLSLCALAKMTAAHYSHIDGDLLLAGCVLHDIGKIYELNYERGFSYSNDGQLLGHIAIGLQMIGDKMRGMPDFPPQLRVLVEHMVLSHHGQLEFGSPKSPQFPEALLLHYIDDLDSKMECMRALIEKDRQVEGCFTSYSSALERTALKLDRYWANGTAPAAAKSAAPVGAANAAPKPAAHDASKPVSNAALNASVDAAPLTAAAHAAHAAPGHASTGAPSHGSPEPIAPAAKPPEPQTASASAPESPAAPRKPVAPPSAATHPLFAATLDAPVPPRADSAFADKLRLALEPPPTEQEN